MEERKVPFWKKALIQISGMAFLFIFAEANFRSLLACAAASAALLVLIIKAPAFFSYKPTWYTVLTGLCAAFSAGYLFVSKWEYSSKVRAIASLLGLSSNTLLKLLYIGLGLLAAVFAVRVCTLFFGYVREGRDSERVRGLFLDRPAFSWKLRAWEAALCMLLSLLITMGFSSYPLNGRLPLTDSADYLYIGKLLHNGAVPYVDFYDNKGLLMYFYQYLAWCISPKPYIGIWIIEYLNILATMLLMAMTARLFTERRSVPYVAVLAVLLICGSDVWDKGNLTEEYALPWLMLATFVFIKYYMTDRFRTWEVMLVGASFVAVLMIRANMISVWVAFMPLVFFRMLWKKDWVSLRKAIVGFVLGAGLAAAPFLLYMLSHHSLEAMWDCYIHFNFSSYLGQVPSLLSRIRAAIGFVLLLSPPAILAYALSITLYKNKIALLNLWYAGVTLVLVNVSGFGYVHYAIIMLPTLVIPMTFVCMVLAEWLEKLPAVSGLGERAAPLGSWAPLLLSLLLAVSFYLGEGTNFKKVFFDFGAVKDSGSALVTYLRENTEEDEDVLVVGNNGLVYLESGRYTQNRFFYQNTLINYSDECYAEFSRETEETPSDMQVVLKSYLEDIGQNSNNSNMKAYLQKLDAQAQAGVYEKEEHEEFYIYRRVK